MLRVHVNGKDYETEQDTKLMRFLRDDLRLTSVKDGCSQGACGTCTVLVDGKATRACIPMLSKLEGKSIVTVEGLNERDNVDFVFRAWSCAPKDFWTKIRIRTESKWQRRSAIISVAVPDTKRS